MKIDKTQITGNRFMFAIACFLQSSALLTAFLTGITRQESWIPVLIGIIIYMPIIYLLRTFMVMFPDKNLLQMLTEIYGTVVGKIIGVLYVWFFITESALNIRDLGDFAKITVMTETPHAVLTLICMLVVVMAVRHGIKVVARYGPLFTIIEFIIVGVSILLLFNQMDFKNLLPVFVQPPIKYVQSAHIITTIPFGEIIMFLMISPTVKKLPPRKVTMYWYLGFAMGVIILIIVLLRDILILGNTLHLFTLPGLVTLRLVSLGETLSRIEILFAIGLTMLLFFKITILSYVSTIAIAQLINVKEYKHLALIIGILILVYTPTLYSNSVEHIVSAQSIEPFVLSLFDIVLPLLTFIIAKLRKLPKAKMEIAKEQEL